MATDPRTYSVYGRLLKETDKAAFIEITDVEGKQLPAPKQEWFPKSQIIDQILASETPDLDPLVDLDKFTIKHWILDQKGLV